MTEMTPRERVLAAIEFRDPDRCPTHHCIFAGAAWRHGEKLADLALRKYPDDFENQWFARGIDNEIQAEGDSMDVVEYVDGWGSLVRCLKGYSGGEVIRPAIEDWAQFASYEFPPLPDDTHFREVADYGAANPDKFILKCPGGMFQQMQHVRGNANVLLDLAEDNQGLHDFADRMVERAVYCAERYVAAGAQCLTFGDYWGAQSSMLIHPDMWRCFFKPRYARVFQIARDAGVHVWFHSDGWILDIIEDLIEIGVTVLNPQHHCMGTRRIGEMVGGRICVRTDIDRQWATPFGSPEDVTNAVKEAIEAFGNFNGGVILHGEIGPEVPFENIEAMYHAFRTYGRYPLTWIDEEKNARATT